MEEKKRKLLNRTDKPDNVVERENEILEKCGKIEEELRPGFAATSCTFGATSFP